jgi:hypothetical protein
MITDDGEDVDINHLEVDTIYKVIHPVENYAYYGKYIRKDTEHGVAVLYFEIDTRLNLDFSYLKEEYTDENDIKITTSGIVLSTNLESVWYHYGSYENDNVDTVRVIGLHVGSLVFERDECSAEPTSVAQPYLDTEENDESGSDSDYETMSNTGSNSSDSGRSFFFDESSESDSESQPVTETNNDSESQPDTESYNDSESASSRSNYFRNRGFRNRGDSQDSLDIDAMMRAHMSFPRGYDSDSDSSLYGGGSPKKPCVFFVKANQIRFLRPVSKGGKKITKTLKRRQRKCQKKTRKCRGRKTRKHCSKRRCRRSRRRRSRRRRF